MAKLAPISGFPEWLPEQKLAEDRLIAQVKGVYASHGFLPIETPSVELVDTLSSKGVVEREIYVVKRLHADEENAEAQLGLHFDLTVPFARYVAQHFSKLTFPFKRYQLQRVWRGERPQKGRFREFYQFDIDTIAREELPLSCDAEVITVLLKAFQTMNLGPFRMDLNSRKLLHGCYSALGLSEADRKASIMVVDKIKKIGPDGVLKELQGAVGLRPEIAERILKLTSVHCSPQEVTSVLGGLGVSDPIFQEGLGEIQTLLSLVPEKLLEFVRVDLSLARGLDYYTGVIFEVVMTNFPEFGTVSSGGRYEDLASQFTSHKLPGVGGSIGITRLMDLAFTQALVKTDQRSTCDVLISVLSEEQRRRCNEVAEEFRRCGVSSEVFFKSPKLGKQLDYADAKGIPFVAFVSEDGANVEIKDLRSKSQEKVSSIELWAKTKLPRGD